MGKKSIELIMNKIAVTIVLAIFITVYIPNFFMDVSMQSPNYYFFFCLASRTDGALLQKQGNKNRDNVEKVVHLLTEIDRS